ncbi:hypothetical protein [Levilactobacillus brevis]|uniref:hypothetical protein n=1 Tax=Levilactobacillus brevis TaxID=1580 RepID=UPI003D16C0F0
MNQKKSRDSDWVKYTEALMSAIKYRIKMSISLEKLTADMREDGLYDYPKGTKKDGLEQALEDVDFVCKGILHDD